MPRIIYYCLCVCERVRTRKSAGDSTVHKHGRGQYIMKIYVRDRGHQNGALARAMNTRRRARYRVQAHSFRSGAPVMEVVAAAAAAAVEGVV